MVKYRHKYYTKLTLGIINLKMNIDAQVAGQEATGTCQANGLGVLTDHTRVKPQPMHLAPAEAFFFTILNTSAYVTA
jgi:hypothetical protein